jgi:hypothetical protein
VRLGAPAVAGRWQSAHRPICQKCKQFSSLCAADRHSTAVTIYTICLKVRKFYTLPTECGFPEPRSVTAVCSEYALCRCGAATGLKVRPLTPCYVSSLFFLSDSPFCFPKQGLSFTYSQHASIQCCSVVFQCISESI